MQHGSCAGIRLSSGAWALDNHDLPHQETAEWLAFRVQWQNGEKFRQFNVDRPEQRILTAERVCKSASDGRRLVQLANLRTGGAVGGRKLSKVASRILEVMQTRPIKYLATAPCARRSRSSPAIPGIRLRRTLPHLEELSPGRHKGLSIPYS